MPAWVSTLLLVLASSRSISVSTDSKFCRPVPAIESEFQIAGALTTRVNGNREEEQLSSARLTTQSHC